MVAGMTPWFTLCADLLIEGNGYEDQQTSEEQTKMLRFMLEGP